MALIIIINAYRAGSDHTGSISPHGPDNGTDGDHVEKKESGEDKFPAWIWLFEEGTIWKSSAKFS